jgi:septal ring factor EnvC (AmiA/AmiB activator)
MRNQYFNNNGWSSSNKKVNNNFFTTLRNNMKSLFNKTATIKSLGESIKSLNEKYEKTIKELKEEIKDKHIENTNLANKISWMKRSISSLSDVKADSIDENSELYKSYIGISDAIDHVVKIYEADDKPNLIDESLRSIINILTDRIQDLNAKLRNSMSATDQAMRKATYNEGVTLGIKETMGAFKAEFKSRVNTAA